MSHNVIRADAYLHTNWHLDACSRLAAIEMGRKLGAPSPFGEGLGSHLTQVAWAEAYFHA